MNADAQKVRSLFLAAVEGRAPEQWAAFLDGACGEDDDLRRRVEVLLQAHQQANSLLDGPDAAPAVTVDTPVPQDPGTVIGPYKLLEPIGEGGFGVVYMAEQQEPVRRRVALKVLKPGMDSRQVVARFEAERQALALMDHPNIARVFGGGATEAGRPYFVMELVKGVPITDFCDQNQLSVRERLDLFADVCRAVQHAHQKGVIHRDLKPSNVLVTMHDATPVAKVIDFGIAKAMDQRLTDKTLFTGFAQMVGTPLYMSPEQAGLSGLDVDTRSDVYSLGVLLYELLTGTTPFDRARLKEVNFDELRRIIREEEPPRPSTRVSTPGPASATASARRQSEPWRLSRLLRGELDWVVMKCLEKDRGRRYDSAGALAADVERYLADEPVLACPPSAWYRLRKFGRRHRLPLLTAGVVAAALVAVVIVLLVSNARIRTETAAKEGALEAKLGAEQQRAGAEQKRADAEGRRADAEKQRAGALEKWRRTAYYLLTGRALNEYRASNVARAAAILDECPNDLRHWEWHYLKRLCASELAAVKVGGDEGFQMGAALSPNATRVGLMDGKYKLRAFDAVSGRELVGLRNKDQYVRASLAFSADGGRLAVAGLLRGQPAVKIRQVVTGQEVASLRPAKPVIGSLAVAFSPDGRRAAATDSHAHLFVWEVSSGKQLFRVDAHPLPAAKGWETYSTTVAFNGDGSRVATACEEDMPVRIWEVPGGKLVQSLGPPGGYSHAVFSPKGTWVAAAGKYVTVREPDPTVRLWGAATGKTLHVLRGHTGPVTCLAFSPDERLLATGGQDNSLTLWEVETGRPVATYRGHEGGVVAAAFTADGRRVVSLSGRHLLKTWDATRAPEFLRLKCRGALHAVFSPDGRHVAALASHATKKDWLVVTWDAAGGAEENAFGDRSEMPRQVAYSPDGRFLAAALDKGGEGLVRVWDVAAGRPHRRFPGEGQERIGPCFTVAYSPDGKLLAAGGGDRLVHVWDTATGAETFRLAGHRRSLSGLSFSRDGRRLASATGGLTWRPNPTGKNPLKLPGDTARDPSDVKVWDLRTGKQLLSLAFGERPPGVALCPDGAVVAVTAMDSTVRLYGVPTGKEVAVLKGHARPPWGVAFSHDGLRVVTGGPDEAIKLWDAKTGQEILTVGHQPGLVRSVAFSPDGRMIVSAGLEEVRLWDATPSK